MDQFEIISPPVERKLVIDAGDLGVKRHVYHALLEIDVTDARQRLKELSAATNTKVSFSAFLVASLGRAVARDRQVQAYPDWRGRLVVFQDVDAVTLVEPQPGAVAIPHILRQVDRRSVLDLSAEIRAVQAKPEAGTQTGRLFKLGGYLPRFVRRSIYWSIRRNPRWIKQIAGTVSLTSVGMFGKIGGWGIVYLPYHTLGVTVGGMIQKPGVHEGKIEIREYLAVTLHVDHDVVDGAPAARFAHNLVEIIESASVLDEKEAG